MIEGFAPDHPSWEFLREEILQRIERSRTALESPGLSMLQTEFARGEIAALRSLIADVEEKPTEPVPAPGYG